ncbi:biotin holocarboxylase synthetase [Pleurotus pulmonarius]|nr:biotin holocarboxylase synthetase [Pleurotus pulmonarius]KAF4607985.1 biotin holocarboxylase synthetase [Pleurotus pulmonarius]
MNVLVYSGPEVVQTSLSGALAALKTILQPNYSVQSISLQTFLSQPWYTSCALLVLPECHRPFQSKSTSAIQAFVENGGAFLGLSTGAKFSTSPLDSDIADMTLGSGSTDPLLRFRQMMKGGYLYPTYSRGNSDSAPTSVTVVAQDGAQAQLVQTSKKEFVAIDRMEGGKSLATYAGEEAAASFVYELGKGKVVLWGPGLEYPLSSLSATVDVATEERRRGELLRATLSSLSLQVPSTELPRISRPLPQFLMGPPSTLGIVLKILSPLGLGYPGSDPSVLKDINDTFFFHPIKKSNQVFEQAVAELQHIEDPANWQPKHIIVCPDGVLPPPELTPLFDCAAFFDALSAAQANDGLPAEGEPWRMGEAFAYSKAVTSTQTMLDKNPQFLTSLPAPFVSMASYQLAGRGRGANVWLSPSGCLQFSLLIRVSLTTFPASKLVFVQYLFALAVAEACREESVLGSVGNSVRLKWPNDLYAVLGDSQESRRKIGGILVNTSFTDGNVDIVIGCGVNVLNEPPITSLHQLLGPGSHSGLTMERTLAAILSKFDKMWGEFVAKNGSFEPFMDLYLSRWLHSDQLVTITTSVPHQRARIVGITADHGLLRTMPESDGYSARGGFIDLQPDGNSFDLMSGMIKTKT